MEWTLSLPEFPKPTLCRCTRDNENITSSVENKFPLFRSNWCLVPVLSNYAFSLPWQCKVHHSMHCNATFSQISQKHILPFFKFKYFVNIVLTSSLEVLKRKCVDVLEVFLVHLNAIFSQSTCYFYNDGTVAAHNSFHHDRLFLHIKQSNHVKHNTTAIHC